MPAPAPAPAPTRPAVSTAESESESESESELDERGYKILALTDLVIQEFDRAVNALNTVKDAVKALREELCTPTGPELTEDVHLTPEQAEALDDDYSVPAGHKHQGVSNAMGDVTISI
jgi:hypothetical protein